MVVGAVRVPKVDALYLSPQDREKQKQLNARLGQGARKRLKYGRILVPPTLIIESLSRGDQDVRPSLFSPLVVPLAKLWAD